MYVCKPFSFFFLFPLSLFSFSYLFAAMVDLLLGLLPIQEILRIKETLRWAIFTLY